MKVTAKRAVLALAGVLGSVLVLVEVYWLSPDFRVACVGGLERIGARGWLVGLLDDSDMDVRGAASDALVRAGASAVPTLIGELDDGEARRRCQACLVLRRIGPPASEALPALQRLMRDDADENVRSGAAKAVGTIGNGDSEVFADLMKLLEEGDEAGRVGAAEAIAAIGSEAKAAIPALVRALRDESPRVREEAAEAIGSMRADSTQAIPALIDALRDPDAKVRGEVMEALSMIVYASGDADAALRDRGKAALEKARRPRPAASGKSPRGESPQTLASPEE